MNQSGTSSAIAIFVAGLAIAFALWSGLTAMAKVIEPKSFSNSGSSFRSDNAEGIVPLSADRFAVVRANSIAVYSIDAFGKVRRTDDVDTDFEPMKKARRYDTAGNLKR